MRQAIIVKLILSHLCPIISLSEFLRIGVFAAGLCAKDIDILVVNCSLFNPTPSLSAMIVNHFHMRSDILSYNLAGANSSVFYIICITCFTSGSLLLCLEASKAEPARDLP